MICSHHFKSHTKPFQCPHCPTRQSTKRHIDRHVNERHVNQEKYYCSAIGCKRSLNGEYGFGGKHFPREENCRKHIRSKHWGIENAHGRSGEIGGLAQIEMDELTKKIRKERRIRSKSKGGYLEWK